ncbi:hypothetical protein ACOMHN_062266 [Nucella lapillus]
MDSAVVKILAGVAGLGVLLLVILLPMSFSGVEYYEYGFKRQKSTGSVDTDEVYPGGKYLIGPDFEFKVFTASAHFQNLVDVSVFTSDKLEVQLDVTFQYFLKKEDLATLHRNYDLYYEKVIRTSAMDALKGEAPNFNTREFITNRKALEAALFRAVRERLGGICCAKDCSQYQYACPQGCKKYSLCDDKTEKGLWVYVKYFQLGAVEIPADVKDRFLKALTLKEEAAREKLLQDAQIVRKKTEADVREIQNKALEVSQEAQAQAQLIGTVAAANYTATVEKARAEGLKTLYGRLGLNTQDLKNSFDYLRTLRTMDTAHFTVDFQQRIVGGVGGK